MNGKYLERFAWLSLATGFVVLALKTLAWQLTGSVGLLSDALESTVNIGAALVASSPYGRPTGRRTPSTISVTGRPST